MRNGVSFLNVDYYYRTLARGFGRLRRSGVALAAFVSLWRRASDALGTFWDALGTLRSLWRRSGDALGTLWARSGRSGDALSTLWGRSGDALGTLRSVSARTGLVSVTSP